MESKELISKIENKELFYSQSFEMLTEYQKINSLIKFELINLVEQSNQTKSECFDIIAEKFNLSFEAVKFKYYNLINGSV